MTEDATLFFQAALAQTRVELAAANERVENLERALKTNRRIGMALGILMTRQALTDAAAFHCLVQASQHQNRKLADIAEDVIFTGHL